MKTQNFSKLIDSNLQNKIQPKSFEVLGLINKGSFGHVYLVEKKDNKQMFALKSLDKKRFLSSNLLRYAVTEKNVLSRVNSPFIVKLYYAF